MMIDRASQKPAQPPYIYIYICLRLIIKPALGWWWKERREKKRGKSRHDGLDEALSFMQILRK